MSDAASSRRHQHQLHNHRQHHDTLESVQEYSLAPSAATATHFIHADTHHLIIRPHNTLTPPRLLDLHREPVRWIAADTVSDQPRLPLAVSYDTGHTAIVWEIPTGREVARFAAYEPLRAIATWMRNGKIAFANEQGNVILFDPANSEHSPARTMFDPVTALAPGADCRTFAIGYLNGSTLIATLHPSFTIQHTLSTTRRSPSPITALAWHGSSSRQKTDMLATQARDGDLRVWSVPKAPSNEPPTVIRLLQRPDGPALGPSLSPAWFAWSKNGRIIQHVDAQTRSWDVRTKSVTWEPVPTGPNVAAIAHHGPSASLFTVDRANTVHQYDCSPHCSPSLVAALPPHPPEDRAQNLPPPISRPLLTDPDANVGARFPTATDVSSRSPGGPMALHGDALNAMELELRDQIMPLSPTSSRTSSAASHSSDGRRRHRRRYLYDLPDSSRGSSAAPRTGTEFSFGESVPRPHDSTPSFSYVPTPSPRPPAAIQSAAPDSSDASTLDLFPHTRARLRDIPLRTPHYGPGPHTPDLLLREMLSVVFGWNDTARALIHDEISSQPPRSPAAVLLSRWLGDVGADSRAPHCSDAMTSSDWMMLALSSIDRESRKAVGETFVQRLLERGDVHPAVAILLGLGQSADAIELYVSRPDEDHWLEAVLLACLTAPADWVRIVHMLRKWGESEIRRGRAELAVRCFSCSTVSPSEPWFSPRSQDAVYAAQRERWARPDSPSVPLSSHSGSAASAGRRASKNLSLKLITTFGDSGQAAPGLSAALGPNVETGDTPIAQSALPLSALSPEGAATMPGQSATRGFRDPSSARTATPGGYTRRNKRLPSRTDADRSRHDTGGGGGRRGSSPSGRAFSSHPPWSAVAIGTPEPSTAIRSCDNDPTLLDRPASREHNLPSPSAGVFAHLHDRSASLPALHDCKPDGLAVRTGTSTSTRSHKASPAEYPARSQTLELASPDDRAGGTLPSGKARAINEYISSVEEAREQHRAHSRPRTDRPRERSRSRKLRDGSRGIRPPQRSPSSPVPMSPEEIARANSTNPYARPTATGPATTDDEDFYKIASPSRSGRGMSESLRGGEQGVRASSRSRAPSRPRERFAGPQSRARDPELSSTMKPFARDGDAESVGGSESSRLWKSEARVTGHHGHSKKELAAKELEERRLSLARRPSAPAIPMPSELHSGRPGMIRSITELGDPAPVSPPLSATRRNMFDPERMMRHGPAVSGTSTASVPIGLPAHPKAMKHSYAASVPTGPGLTPPVPEIPSNASELSSFVTFASSTLSGAPPSTLTFASSTLSGAPPSTISSNTSLHPISPPHKANDGVAPLLPSTVFGGQQEPPRSASVPLPHGDVQTTYKSSLLPSSTTADAHTMAARRRSLRATHQHARCGSRSDAVASIDETLSSDNPPSILLLHDPLNLPDPAPDPPLLPELQHLAGPPPPPPLPPPPMAETNNQHHHAPNPDDTYPHPMARAATASPSVVQPLRRGRGSVSETIGSRFRGFGERMAARSTSRPRGGTTTNPNAASKPHTPATYENLPIRTVAVSLRGDKAPAADMSGLMADLGPDGLITPQPPLHSAVGPDGRLSETVLPPPLSVAGAGAGAPGKTVKEARAGNMVSQMDAGLVKRSRSAGLVERSRSAGSMRGYGDAFGVGPGYPSGRGAQQMNGNANGVAVGGQWRKG